MLNELQKLLNEYRIVPLTEENYADALEIYQSNQSYFVLTEGKEIELPEILDSILTVPEGFDGKNKYCVGIQKNEKMIAVLEWYSGLPAPDCVWLSLLLVHNEYQSRSIGGRITKALIDVSKNTKHKEIRLGIVDKNINGTAFWSKMGFIHNNTAKAVQRDVELNILVFKYDLV